MMIDIPNPLAVNPGPTDAQSFKIKIGGKAINGETPVLSIAVQKVMNKIATLKLYVQDGDPAKQKFSLSNSNDFKPGNEIEVELGYLGNTETVFKGLIVKHSVKAKDGQAPHLYIEAKDKAVLMTLERKSAYHTGDDDIEVMEKLAGAAGLKVKTEFDFNPLSLLKNPAEPKPMVQYYCTDWDFVLTRAEANGYLILTDDGTLKVFEQESKGGLASLMPYVAKFGDNIFEFEGELDSRRTKRKFTARSWDASKQDISEVENEVKDDGGMKAPGSLEAATEAASGLLGLSDDPFKKGVTMFHGGNPDDDELDKWSSAYAGRSNLASKCGRIKVQGNPAIKPGQIIEINGIGDKFDGKVMVTGVLHQFGDIFKTDIQFGWAEDWFYKNEDIMPAPANGILPGIHGLQIGLVTDTDDILGGEFRVKIKMPLVDKEDEGVWARIASFAAGNNRGAFFRPEPEDEVILGFLDNDPRQPVVLGSLHSSKNAPPLSDSQIMLKKESGFVSKNGLKLVFDDIENSIVISDGFNEISMSVKEGVKIKSTLKLSIECNTMMDIKAGGILNINGKVVNIN